MIKRVSLILLAVALLISALPLYSSAVAPVGDEIEASNYLTSYAAVLYSEGTTGKLKLWYQVYAKATMTEVGVYKIVVRKSDGTLVRTIWGSTANGLMATNSVFHSGTYTLSLTSGTTYYCVVTVIAKNSSGSDTRTVTTAAVTCP